jgi:hypothetical protein
MNAKIAKIAKKCLGRVFFAAFAAFAVYRRAP